MRLMHLIELLVTRFDSGQRIEGGQLMDRKVDSWGQEGTYNERKSICRLIAFGYHLAWFISEVPTTSDCQCDDDMATSSPTNSNHTWGDIRGIGWKGEDIIRGCGCTDGRILRCHVYESAVCLSVCQTRGCTRAMNEMSLDGVLGSVWRLHEHMDTGVSLP